MRRLAALSFVTAVVLQADLSGAQQTYASFTSARRAGGATTTYIVGDMDYEVEIENTKNKALQTNLIIEVPTSATTANKVYKTIAVNIPANSKGWVPFKHDGGFSLGGCYHMHFYVKLQNGAAPPATIQAKPNCTFSPSMKAPDAAGPSASFPGKVWNHSTGATATCSAGVVVTTTVENDTTSSKSVTITANHPASENGAKSAATTVPANGSVVVKAKTGPHPKFWGHEIAQNGTWTVSIASANAKPSEYQFALKRACKPTVSVLPGTVAYF